MCILLSNIYNINYSIYTWYFDPRCEMSYFTKFLVGVGTP